MKRFARGLISSLLKLSLFTAAIMASFFAMLGSPDTIKQTLADNNIYDDIISNVIEAAEKNEVDVPADNQLSLDVLKSSATQAFNPSLVQNSVEQGLDGVYRWLNGDVDLPDFQIDLTQAKANFITSAGQAVETHVANLPVCNREQLAAFDPEADPLSLICRPANLSPVAARDRSVAELTNNKEFLPNPVLSADNLSKNQDGKSVFEQAEAVPEAYQLAKVIPWILLGISALLSLAVFFLSETRRQGLKSLGITFLGTGVFMFVTTWLLGFLFERAARPGGALSKSAASNDLQEPLLAVARALSGAFNRTLLIYCIVYAVIGAGVLLVLHFTRPKELARSAVKMETEEPPVIKNSEKMSVKEKSSV